MRKKNSRKIDVAVVSRLWKIFEDKGWEIDSKASNAYSSFNRFCELFEYLNPKQIDLLCTLTKFYLLVKFQDYSSSLSSALEKLPQNHFENIKTLYVVPLLAPEDEKKDKSSHTIAKLFYDMDVKSHSRINFLDIILKFKNKALPVEIVEDDSMGVLFVDDFIGSGGTAIAALNHLKSMRNIPPDRITILSLVAHKLGVEALAAKGYSVATAHLVGRGISDRFSEPEKTKHLESMEKIETWLEVDSEFRLGFKNSEALVTVNRTPNNTFPIYWLRKTNQEGLDIGAPFER